MKKLIKIKHLNPCKTANDWYKNQNSTKEAWENCHRGDWMLWIAAKLQVCPLALSLTKGYCAKTVYNLLHAEESKDAVIAAINFGRGLIGEKELNETANAAHAAYAAANSVRATAYTAYTAHTAAYTAAYAAAYAANAVHTAHTAAYTASKEYIKNQKKTADICRKYLTKHIEKYLSTVQT